MSAIVVINIKKFGTACGISIINFWRFIDKCMGPDLGLDINLDRFYCMSSKCIWTSSIFFEEKKIGQTADKEENGIVSNNSHVDIQCAQCHPCFSSKRHGIK